MSERPPLQFRLHPIFTRQLRVASRRRNEKDAGGWPALVLAIVFLLSMLGMRLLPELFFENGALVFCILLCAESLFFLNACLAAANIVTEHEENTLPGIVISRMTPGRMVLGFWLHAMWLSLQVVLYFVPVFALAYWWGGVTLGGYLRSQWLLLGYMAMVSMGCIAAGFVFIQALERNKKNREKKKNKSESGLLANLFKNTNTQSSTQAVVGLAFVFLFLLPSLLLPFAAIGVAVTMTGLSAYTSVTESLETFAGPATMLSIFAPWLAAVFDLRIPFFQWSLASWWFFPLIYAVLTLLLFLQARFFLVHRRYNTAKDTRLALLGFVLLSFVLVCGLFWPYAAPTSIALLLLWVLMATGVTLQTCLSADSLPEWRILGEPGFPHRHLLHHFYATGPHFSLMTLAPLFALVAGIAYLRVDPIFALETIRVGLFWTLGLATLILLGRAMVAMGLGPVASQALVLVAGVLASVLSANMNVIAGSPFLPMLSSDMAARISILLSGLFPFAPAADGVARLIQLAEGSQPRGWSGGPMLFIESEIGSAYQWVLIAAVGWFLVAAIVYMIGRSILRSRVARRDREIQELLGEPAVTE